MNELITIIIPIYKVEQYLRRCVDSVIAQSYKNLEIILVDDGSPDNCGKICEEYKAKDARIVVIHKQNGGQAGARNDAVKIAEGRLITFVDSDDYIALNYVEELYCLYTTYNADLVQISYEVVYNANYAASKTVSSSVIKFDQKNAIKDMLLSEHLNDGAWGKLYKQDFLLRHPYPVGKIYEDLAVAYDMLLDLNVIVYGDAPLYFYFQRADSTMNDTFSLKQFDEYNIVNTSTQKVIDRYPELRDQVLLRRAFSYFAVLYRILSSNDSETYREQINQIKKSLFEIKKTVLSSNNKDKALKIKLSSLMISERLYLLLQKVINSVKRGR